MKEMDKRNPRQDSELVIPTALINSESGSNSVWVSWRLQDHKLMVGLAAEADVEGGIDQDDRFPVDLNSKRNNFVSIRGVKVSPDLAKLLPHHEFIRGSEGRFTSRYPRKRDGHR